MQNYTGKDQWHWLPRARIWLVPSLASSRVMGYLFSGSLLFSPLFLICFLSLATS